MLVKVVDQFSIRDNRILRYTVLSIKQLEQVTEDLSAVATVNLLNYEINLLFTC